MLFSIFHIFRNIYIKRKKWKNGNCSRPVFSARARGNPHTKTLRREGFLFLSALAP